MRAVMIGGLAAASVMASAAWADTKDYDYKDFKRIFAGEGLEVAIVEGDEFSVSAEGDRGALKRLTIDQHGETLTLGQKRRGLERFSPILWMTRDPISVEITLPWLAEIDAASGADVSVSDVTGHELEASASSGASLDLRDVDATGLRLSANSGASLDADGVCGDLDADANSGASISARDLECAVAEADASSGASISLRAARVTAEASSGASVGVYGATEVEADTSSGGSVSRH